MLTMCRNVIILALTDFIFIKQHLAVQISNNTNLINLYSDLNNIACLKLPPIC